MSDTDTIPNLSVEERSWEVVDNNILDFKYRYFIRVVGQKFAAEIGMNPVTQPVFPPVYLDRKSEAVAYLSMKIKELEYSGRNPVPA